MTDELKLHTGPDAPVWHLRKHRTATTTVKANIPGVQGWEHGTYVSHPYYAFVKQGPKTMLVSDAGLLAELQYIGPIESNNLGGKFQVVPAPRCASQFGSYNNVVMSYNSSVLGDDTGFVITGTDPDFALLPSLPAGVTDHDYFYLKSEPDPDAGSKDQTWGNVFTDKGFGEKVMLRALNIKVLDFENFDNSRASDLPAELDHIQAAQSVLMFPAGTSYNYEAVDQVNVPRGWKYTALGEGHGKDTCTTMSSSNDVLTATMKSAGYHYKAEIGAEIGPVDIGGSYSRAKNHGLTKKLQRISENETTSSESTHVWTEFSLTVDKRNLLLNPDFVTKIGELAQDVKALTDPDLDRFFDDWGTHWVSSATFGSKGTCTETYDKETVRRIVANEVNVDSEWSAGASVKVFGVGGKFDYDHKKAQDDSTEAQREAVKSSLFKTYSCIGGGSCQGGEPGSGGERPAIYLDMRPLSELLAPPFFKDARTTIALRRVIEKAITRYGFEQDAAHEPPLQAYQLDFSEITTTGLASIGATVEFPDQWNGNPYEAGYDNGASMVARGPGLADPQAYPMVARPCHWELPELGAQFVIVVGRDTRYINILLKYDMVESHPVLGDGSSATDTDSGQAGFDLGNPGPQVLSAKTSSSSGGQSSVVDVEVSVTATPVDVASLMGMRP